MTMRQTKSAQATPTTQDRPARQVQTRSLPPYKVILHNDDVNEFPHVIETIVMLCGMNPQDAELRATEAHDTGCAVLLVTHRERAELYAEQFRSRSLNVSIEPDE